MPLVDLLGQDLARDRLLKMVVQTRVPQTLLFSGPQGVGKNLAAMMLAQALSCREPENGDACGKCPACIQIQRKLYPDLLLIAAENQQIKINQVAEIQDFISYSPLVGEHRIVIIKDAHKLNLTAANALLKTLEEPAPAVLFILLSHRHHLLLATILSRCLRLQFVSLPQAAVVKILEQQEPVGEDAAVSGDAILAAAAWSGGSMGRAQFFLVEENLAWGREFIGKFSHLPQATILAALDLAEVTAQFAEREMVFFLLRSFLHDALLSAQGIGMQRESEVQISSADWSADVTRFAALGEMRILAVRQRLLALEQAQGINVNIKLAFEAFFTAIISGIAGSNRGF